MIDKNVEAVREAMKNRMKVGLKKYGVTTERTDIKVHGWIQHLQEELMDAAVYAERLKEEVQQSPFESIKDFLEACEQTTKTDNKAQRKLYQTLMEEEFQEFKDARAAKDDVEELDACCDLIWVVVGYALSRGWNIKGAFQEVVRSNMSKVDSKTGKVLKRADGKVLKPATFSPPDLTKFV
jgi:predicted HAD superfamily Cof-like phosphohydrolase